MRIKFIPLLLLGLFMASCGKQIPEDIIQPADMENILYDYHMSVSLGADLPNMTTPKREALKAYALEKHQVSRALFDSSMVWYTRHANFLYDIYAQLDKRYTMEETRMKTQINKRSGQIHISLSGDSVDVWSDRDIYWLSTARLTNKVTFNLKADTTFRPQDALALEADFTFFNPKHSHANACAMVGLNINLRNDSTYSLVKRVTTSGHKTFYLKPDVQNAFNTVTGFIYCSAADSTRADVLVSGIRLMRYHDNGTDSTSVVTNEIPDELEEKSEDPRIMNNVRPQRLQPMER